MQHQGKSLVQTLVRVYYDMLSGGCRHMLHNQGLKGDPPLVFSPQESDRVFSSLVESVGFGCIDGKHGGT